MNWEKNEAHIDGRPFRALSFRLQGDATFTLPEGQLHVGDKEMLHAPEHCEYEIRSGKEQLIVVHFSCGERQAETLQVIPVADPHRAEALFLALLECWDGKKPGYYYRALSLFYKIAEMAEQQELHASSTARYDMIGQAVDYLQQNYRNPELTVQELCDISGISSTYFRKRFYEKFGVTPNKYLNALRIEYAKELLDSGAYSVERVAGEVGFLDAKYFSTVFRRVTGMTPTEYKKGATLPYSPKA